MTACQPRVRSSCSPRADANCRSRARAYPFFRSYREIVDHYIENFRDDAREDLDWYRTTKSLRTVVENAAWGRMRGGRRHSHYYRRRHGALDQFSAELLEAIPRMRAADEFPNLLGIIRVVAEGIDDIGPLTVYDTAERIGARLGLEPDRVYLHCGVKVGASYLGFTHRDALALGELPTAFLRLLPHEAEDCLCGYRNDIRRIAERRRVTN